MAVYQYWSTKRSTRGNALIRRMQIPPQHNDVSPFLAFRQRDKTANTPGDEAQTMPRASARKRLATKSHTVPLPAARPNKHKRARRGGLDKTRLGMTRAPPVATSDPSDPQTAATEYWVQCDTCNKWRQVPGACHISKTQKFECNMFSNTSCETPQEAYDDTQTFVYTSPSAPNASPSQSLNLSVTAGGGGVTNNSTQPLDSSVTAGGGGLTHNSSQPLDSGVTAGGGGLMYDSDRIAQLPRIMKDIDYEGLVEMKNSEGIIFRTNMVRTDNTHTYTHIRTHIHTLTHTCTRAQPSRTM